MSNELEQLIAIVKKLRLKDGKDYSIYGSGKTFEMELDSKYEDKVLELLRKYNVQEYFFLDSSFPMIYQLNKIRD